MLTFRLKSGVDLCHGCLSAGRFQPTQIIIGLLTEFLNKKNPARRIFCFTIFSECRLSRRRRPLDVGTIDRILAFRSTDQENARRLPFFKEFG
jgi:hypothetical protein